MSRRLALVLFLARLIRKPLPIFTKSRLPVITANRLPPICSYIVFAIIFRCSLGVMFGRCGHRPNAQNTVFSAMGVFLSSHTFTHSMLYSLVMTAVWVSMAVNRLLS